MVPVISSFRVFLGVVATCLIACTGRMDEDIRCVSQGFWVFAVRVCV